MHVRLKQVPLPVTLVCLLLLLFRAAGMLIGLDRLPMVPTVNPEVIINDPAVALSRGHGLVAFSFEHSVNGLDKLYGHFPPGFIALQALVFSIFGFSAISLRALSVFCDLATCVMFLLLLAEWLRQGILDRRGFLIPAVLILLEPTTMTHAREARMESLNTFLGAISLYLCVRATRHLVNGDRQVPRMSLWCWAAVASGLALAVHPAAALMWVVFFAWTAAYFHHLGLARWVLLHMIPPVVMCASMLAAWVSGTPGAIAQMRHLSSFATYTSMKLDEFISARIHLPIR